MIIKRKTYCNCAELPLFNFIKIIVTDDLAWLYAEPKKIWNRNIILEPLWQEVFDEYSKLSGDKVQVQALQLRKEILLINNRIAVIQAAVDVLSLGYEKQLCLMLRNMGFRHKFKPETLQEDLKLVVVSARSLILKREQAQADLEALAKDSEESATEKQFNAILGQLSKWIGFRIESKTTSVMEFINYMDMFKAELKADKQ